MNTPDPGIADRLERVAGTLATQATRAMEAELPWYADLRAQDRSWIGLVAQSGIAAFIAWFRDPTGEPASPSRIFGAAPREFTRVITLNQTVELLRTTIESVEDQVNHLLPADDHTAAQNAVSRFAREVAFAAATVYAQAAEQRGAWDARLEALLVDSVIRGETDEAVRSRAAAIGWGAITSVSVLVGPAPDTDTAEAAERIRHLAAKAGVDALCALQGDRMVVVLGSTTDPVTVGSKLLEAFGAGPVVAGPVMPDLLRAVVSARAAASGFRAAAGWPDAPRPVDADDLLPERCLNGDGHARRLLATGVHGPLAAEPVLLTTVSAYFDNGSAIEATARELFVHPNTVRYRLRRVAEMTGFDVGNPRDAYNVRIALTLGRLLSP